MDIYVDSIEEALKKCLELKRNGEADLFRGQSSDWPTILPSIFRLSGEQLQKAEMQLNTFIAWALSVPQMEHYQNSIEELIAIAQHYGIPTNFLDLTTSPEVALSFSKVEDRVVNLDKKSVVYCFSKSSLDNISNGTLVNINVDNLWRLHSQYGLFLAFHDQSLVSEMRGHAIRIHYPSEQIKNVEKKLLYPEQKSHLETIIDQWFYLQSIEKITEIFSDVPIQIQTNRNRSYPGIFKWRKFPIISKEWEDRNWQKVNVESLTTIENYNTVVISSLEYNLPKDLYSYFSNLVEKPIKEYHLNKKGLLFILNFNETLKEINQIISKLINQCWDGIRILPYSPDEMINCISLTLTLLIGSILKKKDSKDWIEELLGEIEYIEVAPKGGHISAGFISKKCLEKSFSNEFDDILTSHFKKKKNESSREIMKWILEPWLIFDFSIFKKIYVEQFIPTSIYNDWIAVVDELDDNNLLSKEYIFSTSFNPFLLGYVTDSNYRFSSPISLEDNPNNIIYISSEMEKSDIEELFIYCLHHILNEKGDPYQIRFMGYEYDKRGLWEISRVIEQCQWIVQLSGISVLEVLTENKNEIKQSGLGAFDIWLIAHKLIKKETNIDNGIVKKYFDQFWSQLLISNAVLEKRMNNWISEEK